jgi:hypothetical protein
MWKASEPMQLPLDRRMFLTAAAGWGASRAVAASAQPPNVVMIYADDLG